MIPGWRMKAGPRGPSGVKAAGSPFLNVGSQPLMPLIHLSNYYPEHLCCQTDEPLD